ncbi:hypothetical protein HNP90_000713 [Methanococcus maripaludis]|uniref:Uncharacterized protein n=1 Tax=Methanococcus maripaludis TaxID=39152 RepID=A0A7J9PGA6_METMI|nr:hypothetical protein [Methanococcus maripaludis]
MSLNGSIRVHPHNWITVDMLEVTVVSNCRFVN